MSIEFLETDLADPVIAHAARRGWQSYVEVPFQSNGQEYIADIICTRVTRGQVTIYQVAR